MAIITTYPDDSATTDSDKFLTSDSTGATKLTTAATIKSYILTDGNITTSKIADGAVNYSKLLSTIFSSQRTTYTNPGTAGGTFYYLNLGGIKLFWGKTASQSIGTGGATWTVTLPTSFFATIQSSTVTLDTLGAEPKQWSYVNAVTTSVLTIGAVSNTNGASQVNSVLIIGT